MDNKRAMTREGLFRLHNQLCQQALELMRKKNADYSVTSNPFGNFVGSLNFDVEPEIGIMIRMGDKMKRIETFIKKGTLAVKDESATDCIVDLINYTILLAGMLEERIVTEKAEKNTQEVLDIK